MSNQENETIYSGRVFHHNANKHFFLLKTDAGDVYWAAEELFADDPAADEDFRFVIYPDVRGRFPKVRRLVEEKA